MRILGLIPARGGSKRLPGKNTRLLGGKPLIQWTIEGARKSGAFAEILVSTDSPEIADIARSAGASVPWLRPAELASDSAKSIDAIRHAIGALEDSGKSFDAIMLLQATSPFRSTESIVGAVSEFKRTGGFRTVVSVSPCRENPAWMNWLTPDGYLESILPNPEIGRPSQELRKAYIFNGVIYVASTSHIKAGGDFVNGETLAYVVEDPLESLDIDDSLDWAAAEAAWESRARK